MLETQRLETQNVSPDRNGHYTAMLGSASSHGLPPEIFTAGEAHWLGVQVSGQAEQPRVLLVSAPYALKAGDAETLGGFPASAFMLAAQGIKSGVANAAKPIAPVKLQRRLRCLVRGRRYGQPAVADRARVLSW